MVDLNGGAQIEFKANSIVNENGTPYDGPVNVSAHYYDPGDFEIPLTMPGDLRGISKDGLEVQLATFGMMAIEIKDDNQNLLQIAEGQTAKLVFPLEGAFESQAASQIPLWSLDEETGIWIEEGIATLESGSYVAHVEHFSFWNCDEPFPLVEISGRRYFAMWLWIF